MEIITRVELVNYLGEDAGRVVANVNDALTDTTTGVSLGAVNTVGGLVTSFDPVGDPKGTLAKLEGLGKMAEILNPMTAPMAFAKDPEGSIDMVKDLTHFDDIVTSNRPFLGIGELGFDIGTAIVPGGAATKAGAGVRAAEGAAARAEISATERAAGEAGGIASATGGLRNVSREIEGATSKLDDLNKATLDGGKPLSGSPGPLPKPPEPGTPPVTRDPAPGPTGGKPASAPPSGDPVYPPVTHTPHTAPAPVAEIPSAPAASDSAAPASAAPGETTPAPSAPSGGQLSAPPMDAPSVNHPGAMPHDGRGGPNPAPHALPADSPLFDSYVPHDPGPDFTDPNGNLIYPDDADPAKPYAVPGTVVPHVDLARGTLLDRFGFAGGAWLSPDGTPFPFRGLPSDSALKPYFQYVVDDPTKLPPGWSIEQSKVAPWFHQPGGGVQYRIIAPEGERPSVQTLLDWGYLKEVHE
ncbi:hypothetical protein MHPYR_120167 [uncultured Mycobacterium sp.]|uniref:TNT domain-containing protein n=1 Tax=uncultured Mycobacterium sp. TaxID=171292 RepID=A0A1Y5P054_9MYCO|nr:hypothetical protein MHPYR_120167 [uncultured Mycobacterium sp.]